MTIERKATKWIAEVQKQNNIPDAVGRQGQLTYETFCYFQEGFADISREDFEYLIFTKGEDTIKVNLYKLFYRDQRRLEVIYIVGIITMIGLVLFTIITWLWG